MGVEVPSPVVTDRCRELNFTNEGGVGNTTRLLKNIAGLWLVQECRRVWRQAGQEFTWDQLVDRAHQASPLVSLINPDHARFVAPQDMTAEIREFCRSTGQPVPETEGAVISLRNGKLGAAVSHGAGVARRTRGESPFHDPHRGRRNAKSFAVPDGGRCVQSPCGGGADRGDGDWQCDDAGRIERQGGFDREWRDVIRRSFYVEQYDPQNSEPWDRAYDRFRKLLEV